MSILLVNIGEKREQVAAFFKRKNYMLPTLLDSTGEVSRLYRVYSIPAAFIIDKQGKINHGSVGYHNWNSSRMHELFDSLTGQ